MKLNKIIWEPEVTHQETAAPTAGHVLARLLLTGLPFVTTVKGTISSSMPGWRPFHPMWGDELELEWWRTPMWGAWNDKMESGCMKHSEYQSTAYSCWVGVSWTHENQNRCWWSIHPSMVHPSFDGPSILRWSIHPSMVHPSFDGPSILHPVLGFVQISVPEDSMYCLCGPSGVFRAIQCCLCLKTRTDKFSVCPQSSRSPEVESLVGL